LFSAVSIALIFKEALSNPPYTPDHNQIEHVWQYAKSQIANRGGLKFEVIKQKFLNTINHQQFYYKI